MDEALDVMSMTMPRPSGLISRCGPRSTSWDAGARPDGPRRRWGQAAPCHGCTPGGLALAHALVTGALDVDGAQQQLAAARARADYHLGAHGRVPIIARQQLALYGRPASMPRGRSVVNEREEPWDELRAALLPRWACGQPSYHERRGMARSSRVAQRSNLIDSTTVASSSRS